MKILAVLTLLALTALADQQYFSAPLIPAIERYPAPGFTLTDAAGKTINLKQYRGKVVLLDFWATWCTGCKQEIPWFIEFQRQYGSKGLAVIGMSTDESWNILKPFLAEHPIPYRILLADKLTIDSYHIVPMPDTFLIDRNGKLAAAYTQGLVDRADVEANIRTLLSQR